MEFRDESIGRLGPAFLDAIDAWLELDRTDDDVQEAMGEILVTVRAFLNQRGFTDDTADDLWFLAGSVVTDLDPPN